MVEPIPAGTWGRRVFGAIERRSKFTRFYLEITMSNDCVFFETVLVPNEHLEQFPRLYHFTLDQLTWTLENRVDAHAL